MRRLVEVDFFSRINKSEKGNKLKNGGRKKTGKGRKKELNAGLRREVAEAGRGRFFSGIVKSERKEKKTGKWGERKNRKLERGTRRKIGK